MTSKHRRETIGWLTRAAAAALLLAVLPQHAFAEDEPGFGNTGVYFGFSGLYTHNFFDAQVDDALEDAFGADVNVSIDDSWGINTRLGYRATSWFAVEAQYEYVNEFDVKAKVEGLIPRSKIFSIEGHTLTGNVRLILPTWRAQPYILAGAGYSLYESDVVSVAKPFIGSGGKESGFAGRMGGGLDLYITPHIVVNTEVTALLTTQDFSRPDEGSIDELWYVSASAGLRYQF